MRAERMVKQRQHAVFRTAAVATPIRGQLHLPW
jgi:hypothetical protein